MLPVIDARTLFVASAVVFAGLVISVALAWRELKSLSGPDRFAKSYVLFLVGLVLFALQGQLPPFLSYWTANVLLVLGAALVLEGTKLILGLPAGRRLTLWTTAAATVAFGYFTVVRFDADARTILSSAFLAALLGTAGWTSWHRRPRTGARTLETVTAIALGACALLFWARAVAIGTGLVGGEMLDASPWMAVPPLVCTLCAVVWTTTLLANTSRRLTSVVQSKNDLLANLLSVARAAGDESNLDATLERVLAVATDLTGAAGASLLMLDEEGRFVRGLFSREATNLAVEKPEAEIILEKGLAAWVVRNRTTGNRLRRRTPTPAGTASPSQGEKARSALSAPISSGPALAGVLTLIHPEPGHFGEEHRLLLESTTAQIALALRNAQIADARQRATRGQELLNQILEISARRTDAKEIVTLAAEALSRGSDVAARLPRDRGRGRALPPPRANGRPARPAPPRSTKGSSAGPWRPESPSTTTPRPARRRSPDAGAASRFRSGTSAGRSASPASRARGPGHSKPRTSISPRRWPKPSASGSARPPSPGPAKR